MSKAPKSITTTQSTSPDAWSQQARGQVWNAAQAAAGYITGNSPYLGQAANAYGAAAGAGNQGMSALGGNQQAINSFTNPFQQNVLDSIQSQYGTLAKRTLNTIGDQATQAGAFGGDRHGVAEGVAIGELGRNAQAQIANVSQQGFNDSMNRAYMASNLGLAGAGGLAGLGQYMDANSPEQRRLQLLSGTMSALPQGSTSSMTQPVMQNWMSGLLGTVATGAGLASGLGWAPFAKQAVGGNG